MPITPHANGEPLLKRASHIHILSHDSACYLVSKWRCEGSALTSEASSNLLNHDIYQYNCAGNCVIHPDK